MGRTVKAWLPKTDDLSSPWACQISGHFASVHVLPCALFIFLDSCSCLLINVTKSFLFSRVLFYSFLILHLARQVLQPAERAINRFLLSTIFGQS